MSFVGSICRCTTLLVLFLAIFIAYGGLGFLGVWEFMDQRLDSNGNFRSRGILPAFHPRSDWRFHESDIPDLTGRVVLVTGANTGLGFWTTYHLAANNAHVIMGCRSVAKCASAVRQIRQLLSENDVAVASSVTLECATIDLASFQSILDFSKSFKKNHNELHHVVLNAGIMRPPYGLTVDGIEQQLGVNHFGHAYLTKLILPTLEKTAKSQKDPVTMTILSSSAQFDTYPEGVKLSLKDVNNETIYDATRAYGQSKLANVLFGQELASQLKNQNILVNLAHPGAVNTELPRYLVDSIRNWMGDAVFPYWEKYVGSKILDVIWQPRDASLNQVFTTVSDEIVSGRITGKYYHPIGRETPAHVKFAPDTTLQQKFWDFTNEVIKNKSAKLK